MGTSYTAILVVGLLFLALVADCSKTESEVQDKNTPSLDPKPSSAKLNTTDNQKVDTDSSKRNSKSKIVDSAESDRGQAAEKPKEVGVQDDLGTKNSSESAEAKADDKEILSGANEGLRRVKAKQQRDDERKNGNGSNNKGNNPKIGKEEKPVRKKEPDDTTKLLNKGNEGSSSVSRSSSVETVEEKPRVEECDSSYMCVDEKRSLVACLRVPGNDSPDLSLLIQNKAKRPLRIKISAPASVQLEKSQVQLQPKEDKKVKVSLGEGDGTSSLIIITTQDGHCALDFKDLISHNSQTEQNYTHKLAYLGKFTRPHFYVAFLVMTTLLLVASACACVGLRRKFFLSNKYQLLDMEHQHPVSAGGEISKAVEAEPKDIGWDDDWGDDAWDIEEAPMTPTLPVTPSVSSRGLAARRLSKEKDGWKD